MFYQHDVSVKSKYLGQADNRGQYAFWILLVNENYLIVCSCLFYNDSSTAMVGAGTGMMSKLLAPLCATPRVLRKWSQCRQLDKGAPIRTVMLHDVTVGRRTSKKLVVKLVLCLLSQ